jgi:hypothetical protein
LREELRNGLRSALEAIVALGKDGAPTDERT